MAGLGLLGWMVLGWSSKPWGRRLSALCKLSLLQLQCTAYCIMSPPHNAILIVEAPVLLQLWVRVSSSRPSGLRWWLDVERLQRVGSLSRLQQV